MFQVNPLLSRATVVQWVKRWPAKTVVADSNSAGGGNLSNLKRFSSGQRLSLSAFHPPDIVEILLKRLLNCKPSIYCGIKADKIGFMEFYQI